MALKKTRRREGTIEYDKSTVTCDISTAQCDNKTIKCEKKNKGTTEYDKNIVTCDVGTAQCEDDTIKCEEKIRKYQMWQKYGHMWCWYYTNVKKKKGNHRMWQKVQSHVMLVLHNVRMIPSNIRKK